MTSVAMSTPGPERWKLCSSERSWTSRVYVPASRCFTAAPLESLSEIPKPGPTEPMSCPSAAPVGAAATRQTAATAAVRARRMLLILAQRPGGLPGRGSAQRFDVTGDVGRLHLRVVED